MKISIEIDENVDESEIVIRCSKLDNTVAKIQQAVAEISKRTNFIFYKGNTEYYIPLEEILPKNFIRAAKSTIINVNHVYSVDRNITSASSVSFYKSVKQVYVSRGYYKSFRQRLEERKHYEDQ